MRLPHNTEDWAVLKWGWLAIFLLHLAFLIVGIHFMKEALRLEDPTLLVPSERRIGLVIEALYSVTIAFSILLLILAVFVLEIFRAQRRILEMITSAEARTGRAPAPATLSPGAPPAAGAGP